MRKVTMNPGDVKTKRLGVLYVSKIEIIFFELAEI